MYLKVSSPDTNNEGTPICRNNHIMNISSYAEEGYGSGWVCSGCRNSFLDKSSRERWFCKPCKEDYCYKCHSKKETDDEKKKQDSKFLPLHTTIPRQRMLFIPKSYLTDAEFRDHMFKLQLKNNKEFWPKTLQRENEGIYIRILKSMNRWGSKSKLDIQLSKSGGVSSDGSLLSSLPEYAANVTPTGQGITCTTAYGPYELSTPNTSVSLPLLTCQDSLKFNFDIVMNKFVSHDSLLTKSFLVFSASFSSSRSLLLFLFSFFLLSLSDLIFIVQHLRSS